MDVPNVFRNEYQLVSLLLLVIVPISKEAPLTGLLSGQHRRWFP